MQKQIETNKQTNTNPKTKQKTKPTLYCEASMQTSGIRKLFLKNDFLLRKNAKGMFPTKW